MWPLLARPRTPLRVPGTKRLGVAHNSAVTLHRRTFLVASLVLASFAARCAEREEKQVATSALDRHFGALQRRSFEAALANYDDHFFTQTTRSEWRNALASVVEKLGTFRKYEILASGLTYKKVAGPGAYLRYRVAVTYSKSPSIETFYLFRREGDSGYRIVGHQIDAEALGKN